PPPTPHSVPYPTLFRSPGEVVTLPHGCVPQTGDQLQPLLQQIEPADRVREVDGVGPVLGFVPAGVEAEFDPAAAHLVDLGDGDRSEEHTSELQSRFDLV